MAEFKPNKAQVSAIHEEGANILVSAGAGSGKTTVLVERVLRMIISEQVDIDTLIIITFTRAAAANMKEKIYSRIRKALKDESLSETVREHLRRQMMKVFSAKICTIDALCMDIVKEHFQLVDIDPGFRIADEAEIRLLMQDTLKALIESHYADPTEEFLDLVQYYTDKDDAGLEEIILTMYRFSQSHPEPENWMRRSIGPYIHADSLGNAEDPLENRWHDELKAIIIAEEQGLLQQCETGIELCELDFGPASYRDNFLRVLSELEQLFGQSFDFQAYQIRSILENWKSLPRAAKGDVVSDELKELAKNLYAQIKKTLVELNEKYFYQSYEEMYQDMGKCAKAAQTIVDLTLEYTQKLAAEKRIRQIADFGDVAHFALDVLVRKNEDGAILRDARGQMVCTEAADAISKVTREIIVDEYQDTNRLQDALIEALSSARFGRPNVFMVGDVKQSIYGFRMACPDLFIEKYNLYADGLESGKRIILGENYRSRRETVHFINYVFEKIMLPEVGGINYQDENQMIAGAQFPQPAAAEQVIPEVIFVNAGGKDGRTAEAYEIAKKIEEIVSDYYVRAEDAPDGLRRARYSDIAILTRKANQPALEKMLTDRRIPVEKASNKGFFSAFEIRLALDLFKITDNPYQDIPLAAVLLSPVAGLNANILAKIKLNSSDAVFRLYDACRDYAQLPDAEGADRLSRFLLKLEHWRKRAEETGMLQLADEILEESGLYCFCSAMTYGEGRKANLDFLKTMAEQFSKGSYSGLFNFIRYIEQMQKAEMDFGQAPDTEGTDAVHMMTIHKSKGLEFPVVILADGGRQIADLERNGPIYLDNELGLGIECRDVEKKLKKKTLLMETIGAKRKRELLAEEIRLLYVAMSRAKEKLIITGASGTMKSRRKAWESSEIRLLPDAADIRKDLSYLFLLGDAMKCATEEEKKEIFSWEILDPEEVELERAFEIFSDEELRRQIGEILSAGEAVSKEELEELAGIYAYSYPFLSATRTNVKVTASQLEQHETNRDGETEPSSFKKSRSFGENKGAERGNAYHKLFEKLDYAAVENCLESGPDPEHLAEQVRQQILMLVGSGHLTDEAAEMIDPEKIVKFLLSDIGGRMRRAALSGTLLREQQFVMAAEIDGNPEGLLQGIIDALFTVEDGSGKGIVLVDYKTDRNSEEQYYIDSYHGQQDAYEKAIVAATGLPVREKILYSVELDREIYLPLNSTGVFC